MIYLAVIETGLTKPQNILFRKLKQSEEKYRTLFQNMAEEVHFWQLVRDEHGQIKTWRLVDVNPPTLKTWGRQSVDEIRGKTTDEIFGPGATEHYLSIVQKIMTEGVPHSFEDYFPNLDKYFRFTSVPLGEYFITTGADITGIKKAELALRESEERFRKIFEHAPTGIAILDWQGRFIQCNPSHEAILGYTEEQLRSMDFASLVHPEDREANLAEVRRLQTGELPFFEIENRYIRKNGQPVWVHKFVSLLPDTTGRPAYIIALVTDITGRKQAEEALRKAHDELEVRVQERTAELSEAFEKIRIENIQRKELEDILEKRKTRFDFSPPNA